MIETSLASLYLYSRAFSAKSADPMFATGGPTGSSEIMRRVAAIWNRPIVPIERGGPALGAAVAGASALDGNKKSFDVDTLSAAVLKRRKPIKPITTDVEAFHGKGAYLKKFAERYSDLLANNPV